jgi:hypothetical protein
VLKAKSSWTKIAALTATICSVESAELATSELLRKILLLQQIQIAQNNTIIKLLSHIARDPQALHSVPED